MNEVLHKLIGLWLPREMYEFVCDHYKGPLLFVWMDGAEPKMSLELQENAPIAFQRFQLVTIPPLKMEEDNEDVKDLMEQAKEEAASSDASGAAEA